MLAALSLADLGNLGSFFGGLAALGAIPIAIYLRQDWKAQKRAEVSERCLIAANKCRQIIWDVTQPNNDESTRLRSIQALDAFLRTELDPICHLTAVVLRGSAKANCWAFYLMADKIKIDAEIALEPDREKTSELYLYFFRNQIEFRKKTVAHLDSLRKSLEKHLNLEVKEREKTKPPA